MANDPSVDLKDDMNQVWAINRLPDDSALLRRIAHNTNVIRLVLLWALVVVPAVFLIVGIVALVMIGDLTPAETGTSLF